MPDKTQKNSKEQPHENAVDVNKKQVIIEAHTQADKDMEEDAEFTATSPNDDLDEEESVNMTDENPL